VVEPTTLFEPRLLPLLEKRSGEQQPTISSLRIEPVSPLTAVLTTEAMAVTTSDFIDGQKVISVDRFRKDRGLNDAANTCGQLLCGTSRYEAFKYASDPVKFAEALQHGGYATDPQYAQKLKGIINKYDLAPMITCRRTYVGWRKRRREAAVEVPSSSRRSCSACLWGLKRGPMRRLLRKETPKRCSLDDGPGDQVGRFGAR
jgi:hypothetical protein